MAEYINVSEFMDRLKAEGLVIGRPGDFEEVRQVRLKALRKRLMKLNAITVKQVVDGEFLPLKTKKGVMDWIGSGKIKSEEVISGATPKAAIKILTSAIKRLGYDE